MTEQTSKLNWNHLVAKSYAVGGCIIGFLQIVDGSLMLAHGGGSEGANDVISYIEVFLWFPISIIAVVAFVIGKTKLLSPISYVVYDVLMWTAVVITVLSAPHLNVRDAADAFVKAIPTPLILCGIVFGTFYAIVNIELFRDTQASGSAEKTL